MALFGIYNHLYQCKHVGIPYKNIQKCFFSRAFAIQCTESHAHLGKKKDKNQIEVHTAAREIRKQNRNIPEQLQIKLPSTTTKKYLNAVFKGCEMSSFSNYNIIWKYLFSKVFSASHKTRTLPKFMIHDMICKNLVINIFISTVICYSIIQTFIDKTLSTSLKICKY